MKNKKKPIINIKKKNPYFSLITVVKNDEKNIKTTIQSIKKQTFKNFEYIIIDGNSKDKTIENILAHKKSINFLISENDKGIYYAMNKGIKICKGEVVVFVNSGDILFPNALKYVYEIFNKKRDLDFVIGTVKRNYSNITILKFGFNKKKLLTNFNFATSHSTGFFLKRKQLNKFSFNTKYKCSSDYDLYYKLLITNNLKGSYTKKNKMVGEVMSGGFSSKISFFDHLIEETKIRLDNKQNFFLVSIIFVNAILKKFFKIIIQ